MKTQHGVLAAASPTLASSTLLLLVSKRLQYGAATILAQPSSVDSLSYWLQATSTATAHQVEAAKSLCISSLLLLLLKDSKCVHTALTPVCAVCKPRHLPGGSCQGRRPQTAAGQCVQRHGASP
jgi:hypothetical protein